MTPVTETVSKPAPQPVEEYPFGWREVPRTLPDGTITYDRLALTLEDVLHPQEDDVVPQNNVHLFDVTYLFVVLHELLAGNPTALVLSDVLIYWDIVSLRQHAPDVSIFFGIRQQRPMWHSFPVAQEGVRPEMLIEVVSLDTRANDTVTKVEHYHRARVPWYVIVDREDDEGPITLIGYRYTPQAYVPLPLDAQGRLWLAPVGLWLGTRDNRVVLYDGNTGEELGDYGAIVRQLTETRQTLTETQEELTEAREELTGAREELTGAREELTGAREELTEAQARIRDLEAELKRLRGSDNP